jgi:N6-adenosine-specific RNA methylase IME4
MSSRTTATPATACGEPAPDVDALRGGELSITDTSSTQIPQAGPAGNKLEFHPLAQIFPLIEGAEFDDLVEDVRAHGVREPIWIYDGQILDGRNRYRASAVAGVDCPMREYWGEDPVQFVVSLNLKRRHLNESQRALARARLRECISQGGDRRSETFKASIEALKKTEEAFNVGDASVDRARVLLKGGTPELVRAVDSGKVSVSAAADVATKPKDEQREIVARGEKEILEAAKAIRTERADKKRAERTKLLNELSNKNAPLPDRRYSIIYADPPWQYDFSPSSDRSVENHYPTMPIEDIVAMKVAGITTPDAMLFLWVPPSFYKKGLMVLEAWGFELATSMVWVKDKIGTGIYVRQRHEFLLLGKRGQPITPRPGAQPDSVIEAPRDKHSAKPEKVYDLIEQMYPGLSYIELFCRSPREGWDAWGNQAQEGNRAEAAEEASR